MKEDVVFNAMVFAMENNLQLLLRGMTGYTSSPIKINLGRQAGHTTAAAKFMQKYHNRCVLMVLCEDDVRRVKMEYAEILGTNVDHIYNIRNTDYLDKFRGTKFLRGKDVIIVDTASLIDGYQKRNLSLLIDAVNRANTAEPTAIFELQ